MMNDMFADLDPVEQCIRSGDALGHLGAAGTLVALAVAAGAAEAEQKPVLLVAVAHPVDRALCSRQRCHCGRCLTATRSDATTLVLSL